MGGTTIPDTVSISSGVLDPNLANNSSSVTVTVGSTTAAALAVADSASPTIVQASGNITYSPVVSNIGGTTTSVITFTGEDPCQHYLRLHDAPKRLDRKLLHDTVERIHHVHLFRRLGGWLRRRLRVDGDGECRDRDWHPTHRLGHCYGRTGGTGTASATTTVAATSGASLLVTDLVSPTSQAPLGIITFYPVVTNIGGAATSAATFTETVPSNTTLVSMTPPSGWLCGTPSGGTITCTNPSGVAVGSSGTFALVLTVNSGTASGTQISDAAQATATTGGTSSASAKAIVETANSADLAVVIKAAATVQAGSTILYTNVVTNNGYSASSGATLTLPIPANTSYASSTPPPGWTCGQAGGNVVCAASSAMAANTSVTIPITLTVSPSATGSIAATATVSATTLDPVSSNNSSAVITSIVGGTATLALSTTAPPTVFGRQQYYLHEYRHQQRGREHIEHDTDRACSGKHHVSVVRTSSRLDVYVCTFSLGGAMHQQLRHSAGQPASPSRLR